jgi:hypothetical protein
MTWRIYKTINTINHVVTGREESNGPSNELPTATRDLTADSLADLFLPGSRRTPFVQNFPNAELYELADRAVIKENNVGGSPGDSRRSADAKRW